MIDTTKFRLPIRRCRRCGSWLGIITANRHECHKDDPIVDAILTEYAARLQEQTR